jgi:peptide/nickel transport system substrate-binding protein
VKRTLLAFTIAMALALMGASSANSLIMAMSAQPETLDPHTTAATSSFQVMRSIYDTLVEVDRQGNLVPALAESWTISDDGLSWRFHLRDGVTFHDGSPLTSADVKATLGRLVSEEIASPKADEFAAIDTIETPDALTVVLRLTQPSPPLLASLASGWGAILPAEKIAAGHDFGNDPIGTGPFRLERWVRDSHVELRRFEAHYAGSPQLERVTIRFVADSALQVQGLLAGEFDVIDSPAPADQELIERNPDLRLVRDPSGLVLVVAINTRRPYLSDVRVRQALNYAIDKESVLEVAYGGGEPVGSYMEAGSPWLPETITPYPYDPERARALLQEAGVPDAWQLDLVLPQPYEAHINAGQMVQAMLRAVNIDAQIRIVEWGVWLGEVFRGARDFDLTVIGHTGKLDPTGRLGNFDAAERNYVGFENPRASELMRRAAVSADWQERQALYAEVLQIMHQEPPFVYLGTPYTTYAHRAHVEGFWITPLLDTFNFREVTLR